MISGYMRKLAAPGNICRLPAKQLLFNMTTAQIIQYRLHNQQLSQQLFNTPQQLVTWMGAIQSQDYGAARWALGQRVAGASDSYIEDAFARGDILRTHILRPTWHFVAPADIRWMLMLTAPRIIAQCAHAYRTFELDAAVFRRSHKTLEKILAGGRQLTRDEIAVALRKANVNTDDLRFIHLMMRAELDGLICSGGRQGKQFTYTLLDERVPAMPKLSRDEALATLTTRYFQSHGPATLQDFAWWSGLTTGIAKEGMELTSDRFINTQVDGKTYWFADSEPTVKSTHRQAYLLPNYDEYVVAYKDRGMLMDEQHNNKLDARGNVLFNNVIIINNKVAGLWKRIMRANEVVVHLSPFEPFSKSQNAAVNNAVKNYKQFMQ